jgi:hypothetical protein
MLTTSYICYYCRLYVEIKLGGGVKPSHIAVADNDDPAKLAKVFCKIYSLDTVAEKILTDVVLQNMVAGGIPIGGALGKTALVGDGDGNSVGDEDHQDEYDEADDEKSAPFHENDL